MFIPWAKQKAIITFTKVVEIAPAAAAIPKPNPLAFVG